MAEVKSSFPMVPSMMETGRMVSYFIYSLFTIIIFVITIITITVTIDAKNGRGKRTTIDGWSYEGQWKDGK
jgi:hypothetical protein